jgi:hypothetical protein
MRSIRVERASVKRAVNGRRQPVEVSRGLPFAICDPLAGFSIFKGQQQIHRLELDFWFQAIVISQVIVPGAKLSHAPPISAPLGTVPALCS